MFKDFPEVEFVINKTASNISTTIDFGTAVYIKSLEYFNEITDKMFYSWTHQFAENINNANEYTKKNINEVLRSTK